MSNKQIKYRNILEKRPKKYLCPICGLYHDVPKMMPLKEWKIEVKCPNFPEYSMKYEVESVTLKKAKYLYFGFEMESCRHCLTCVYEVEAIGKNEQMILSYKESKDLF